MQRLNKDQLAELPAPVSLTPDQLMTVAAGTSAVFKGAFGPVIVAGGIMGPALPNGPFMVPQVAM